MYATSKLLVLSTVRYSRVSMFAQKQLLKLDDKQFWVTEYRASDPT